MTKRFSYKNYTHTEFSKIYVPKINYYKSGVSRKSSNGSDALTGPQSFLVSVMTDDYPHVSRAKGRSASICAATSASVERLPQSSGTPDGGTPSSRRRRPAARSQSARLTSGRSIKRRAAVPAASNPNNAEVKGHCNSEPKLDQTDGVTTSTINSDASPNIRRRNSTRRGTSVYHRKSAAFLDVPDSRSCPSQEEEDEDSYRLRSFSFTSKGKGKN